jgi:hypothetical protein
MYEKGLKIQDDSNVDESKNKAGRCFGARGFYRILSDPMYETSLIPCMNLSDPMYETSLVPCINDSPERKEIPSAQDLQMVDT